MDKKMARGLLGHQPYLILDSHGTIMAAVPRAWLASALGSGAPGYVGVTDHHFHFLDCWYQQQPRGILAQPFHCTDKETEAQGQEATSFPPSKEDIPLWIAWVAGFSWRPQRKIYCSQKGVRCLIKIKSQQLNIYFWLRNSNFIWFNLLFVEVRRMWRDLPEDEKQKHWENNSKGLLKSCHKAFII